MAERSRGHFELLAKKRIIKLIIDGFKYPFLDGEEFKEIIESYVPQNLVSVGVYTFSTTGFGMAGYSGVIVLKTKSSQRFTIDSDRKFNSEGFQIFQIPGFTEFTAFPNDPPSDQFLKRKPTIYWNPFVETKNGLFKSTVKVPYGVKMIRIKLDGRTTDGEVISKVLELRL